MEKVNIEKLLKRYESLKSERANYETLWQDVAKYTLPQKAYITRTQTPGTKPDYDVYDSTAMQSNTILAAGLHSYLTNPSSKWFKLALRSEALMNDKAVKLWLDITEKAMYDAFNGSNFAQQIHELYTDLPVFGIGCLYMEEDAKEKIRFYCRNISEIFITEDEFERITTVYRKFQLTARQAFEKWGTDAGEVVLKAIEDEEDEKKIDFLHYVGPRYKRDMTKKDSVNMPYESIYCEISKKHEISVGGYTDFPYFIPRFMKGAGEVYGIGPAALSYADIKMLNLMDKTNIVAAQKLVDPPIVLPHDGFLLPIRYTPGAINYRTKSTANDKIEYLGGMANMPVALEMTNQRRETIKNNFFVSLFLMLEQVDKGKMTATEVAARNAEKMLILAPTLGRLMSELLNPMVIRTFNILLRSGFIPEPPPILQGQDYIIDYISPLAMAQKMSDMNNMNNFLTIAGQIAQAKPEVLDKIDADATIDTYATLYNIPPKMVLDEKEVGAIRAERAKMMAMQQAVALAQQGGDAFQKVTKGIDNARDKRPAPEVANAG